MLSKTLSTHVPWYQFKFYTLCQVVRQSDITFHVLLINISNEERLNDNEYDLVKSRFMSVEEAKCLCPDGIRLFYSSGDVNA